MSIPTSKGALLKSWHTYLEFKRPYLAPTTIVEDYSKVTARLELMPLWVESGQDFIDWMQSATWRNGQRRWSYDTVRTTLVSLKAATAWAKKTGLQRQDPFEHIPNYKKRRFRKLYQAFSAEERAIILTEAKKLSPADRRWIQALFYTGCRPSELRALKVSHWAADGSVLNICSAFPMMAKCPQGTKNGKTTPDYPVNAQLAKLLEEATLGAGKEDWIFRSVTDGPFHYRRFQANLFKPLVNGLAEKGELAFALSQYHARHTWITEAIAPSHPSVKPMSIKDVAYLTRTSTEIILNHYAQQSRDLMVPEI